MKLSIMKSILTKLFQSRKRMGRKLLSNDTLTAKTLLRVYFDTHNIDWQRLELHYIETKRINDTVEVTVTLGRPGLLIGLRGATIDGLTEHLTKRFGTPVKIRIVEYSVWSIYH